MTTHGVRLPYPDRAEATVGRCSCGWSVLYGWGQHGDAAVSASEHVEATTLCESLELAEVSGVRLVLPGRSL